MRLITCIFTLCLISISTYSHINIDSVYTVINSQQNVLQQIALYDTLIANAKAKEHISYKDKKRLLELITNNKEFESLELEKCKVFKYYAYTLSQLLEHEQAIDYGLQALKIAEKHQDRSLIIDGLYTLGNLNYYIGNTSKAIEYFERIISLYPDVYPYATYSNLAMAYQKIGEIDKAKNLYITLLAKDFEVEYKTAVYINLGTLHGKESRLDSALYFFKQANQLAVKHNYFEYEATSLLNIGNIHYLKKEFEMALQCYLRTYEIYKEVEALKRQPKILRNIKSAFVEMGKLDSALYYYKLYDSVNVHVINEEMNKQAIELQVKYETEKKEAEIINQKLLLEKEQSEKQMLFAGMGGLTLLLIFLAGVLYNYKKRMLFEKQLAKAKEKNYLQQVDDLMQKQEVDTLNALLFGQEEERKRISRDLHDRVGSLLSALKMSVNSENPSRDSIDTLLNESIVEVRKISHNLSSGVLDKFGLTAALEDFAVKIQHTAEINVELFIDEAYQQKNKEVEIEVYRIAQELISNALKHAKASKINLQILQDETNAILSVEDDGLGFAFQSEAFKAGIGLDNIKARIAKIKADFKIDSSPGKGTFAAVYF
jgi:two-component system NarL family sensor kinase